MPLRGENTMTKDFCQCGYFHGECECCGEGKVCPVCNKEKWTTSELG